MHHSPAVAIPNMPDPTPGAWQPASGRLVCLTRAPASSSAPPPSPGATQTAPAPTRRSGTRSGSELAAANRSCTAAVCSTDRRSEQQRARPADLSGQRAKPSSSSSGRSRSSRSKSVLWRGG
eukprot:272622-Chlamydomonas_euryale.AAC.6